MGRSSVGAAACIALALGAPGLGATDLNVSVRSGGLGSVTVPPGTLVSYSLVGELSDAASDGLSLFSLDLAYDGGALAPAAAPAAAPITSFAVPAGVNNPQGFGGLPVPAGLSQVGGGQNTLNNSFGPFPLGAVVSGVAQPGAPVTLASGQLTAPLVPGSYTLMVTRVVATVISQGASGVPVWKVEPAGSGTLQALTINVPSTASSRIGRRTRKAKP